MSALPDIDLISQSQSAASLLDPIRLRLLGSLREPDSAAGLARRLGLPRQKANYHLRALEEAGLVEVVEERRKGKVMERILRATATHYLICPSVLGPIAADSAQVADQFSCAYLIAATARTLSEVALLREKAQAEGKELATLSMQVDVSFPGPAERKAFT